MEYYAYAVDKCLSWASQCTQNICITFIGLQRRPNFFDGGPTLYIWYTNVLCLLGYLIWASRLIIVTWFRVRFRTTLEFMMLVSPLTAKLFNLNFHPLEVVSRWRDPQLQVSENYSDLTKWRSTLFKSCWLMSQFIFNIFKMWYLVC